MKRKTKYKFRPPFNPAIEMGVMLDSGAVIKYGNKYGTVALGGLMQELTAACNSQDRRTLMQLPIVAKVTTRPAGGTHQPY